MQLIIPDMSILKKVTLYSFIVLTVIFISSFTIEVEFDFSERWESVEKLTKNGQPRSALVIVDEIYDAAKKDNNTPQIIKSLIYRVSLQSRFEEDHIINSISTFTKRLETASSPEKEILQSLIAELYQAYYKSNSWVINKRKVVSDSDDTDISTWDAIRYNKVIEKYYNQSISNRKALSDISLANYEAILANADSSNTTLFPYLYDLLVNRALNYFTSSNYELSNIGSVKDEDFIKYLVPYNEFQNIKINPNLTKNLKILNLFQSLTILHSKNNNTEALVDIDLRRLAFVYNNTYESAEANSKYINTLSSLANKYKSHPVFVAISYEVANQYYQKGSDYSHTSNEANKYNYAKADSICKVALGDFPSVNGSNKCLNLIERIETIGFGIDIPVAQAPNKPTLSLLEFKNVTKLYFKIVKGDPKANADRHTLKEYIQNELRKESVKSWTQELPVTKDYRSHTTEIKIPELPLGYYVVFISDSPDFNTTKTIKYKPIWITNLSYITNENPSTGNTDMYIMDRITGKSIGLVNITIYKQQYNNISRDYDIKEVRKITADKYGYAEIKSITGNNYGTFLFEFDRDGDKLFSENYLNFFRAPENNKANIRTFLFTDRAVYRPGQTVYFKAIVIEEQNKNIKLLADSPSDIDFLNVNRKKISTTNYITDENGSYNGQFTIPLVELNGNMTLRTKTGNVSFLVEEYKRPTFEVTFDTIGGQPKLGQEISVIGKAMGYAGNSVDGAEVSYRVFRRASFPIPYYGNYRWFPPYNQRDIEISNGNIKTLPDGTFNIKFEASPDNSISEKFNPVFNYEIVANVTDITGEVQIGNTSIKVGHTSVILHIDIDETMDLEKIKLTSISANNLNGGDVKMDASLKIYKLIPPQSLLIDRSWAKPEFNIISKEDFETSFPNNVRMNEDDPFTWEKVQIKSNEISIDGTLTTSSDLFTDLDIGQYLITAEGVDGSGEKVINKRLFTLFSTDGKKMPVNQINWSTVTQKVAEPGETIKLIIGSSASKTKLLYEIVNGNTLIDRQWVTLNKGQKVIEIPVLEDYRGNFSIVTAMVRYNQFYTNNYNINVPFTNKELDIVLETYRNHISPGQKEEWKVTISGKDGQKLSAELLAGMYDASLDIFGSNKWQMNLYHSKNGASQWESNQFHNSWSSALFVPETKYYPAVSLNYPTINWFGYYFMGYNPIAYDQSDFQYRKSVIAEASMGMEEEVISLVEEDMDVQNTETISEEEDKTSIIPVRTNFNETAFFYPNLRTDESGNVSFSFTAPDALTEWKIRMLAYTSDLKVGTLEQSIKSQKELMIVPNVPRFVRHGDTLLFTAKVVNFSDKEITAKSEIEFFDAITMVPVSIFVGNISNQISSEISAKQSKSISWKISIPDNISMLAYRITSSTSTTSDGEERMFPVLTNRMLVTNSLSMNVGSASEAKFNFESLANYVDNGSIRNYRYTLEFTSNPTWYAVQALPSLSKPTNNNTMSLFNMYFANSISSYIVNSNPVIRSVFESWKNITPDAFLSNLQKNEELKNAVIGATPWVLDAEDESEQKRRIGILFDVNRMSDEKENVITKLIKAQLSSGAWPWFNGMRADRHTTQSIVLGMAKLHHKGVLDLKSDNKRLMMVRKAVKWLDGEITNDYKKLKKVNSSSMKDYQLRSSQTQYLYLRSILLDIIPLNDKSEEAVNYYTNQAKKYWLKQSNYLQGMTAIMLYKFGHRNESEAIIRSLKERSLYSKEMGMYWRQSAGWNWYQAPVETQAMMIEAFSILDNNPTLIEQQKVWLIKQKQTQHWKTTSATSEAIFALLMYGNSTLTNNELVNITVGDKELDITGNSDTKTEAGTGYFSTTWSGEEITPELAEITIVNPNNNIAWGAAYWQFFEDMDKIESHDSPLSIKKKLFIESNTDKGEVMTEIEAGQKLSTGDKVVVRLIISSDRNMEYVHLKDMRATTFEPISQNSGYTYSGGLWYYKNITDVSTEFFIRYLQKGTYVVDYPLFVTQEGDFTNGIATIQSMYAPEFGSHSSGIRISVED